MLLGNQEMRLDIPSQTLEVRISWMTCSSCVATIENVVSSVEGVETVSVNLITETGTVEYDPSKVEPVAIVESITDLGFEVEITTRPSRGNITTEDDGDLRHIELRIAGMTCASCVATIENILSQVDGVEKISVNLI